MELVGSVKGRLGFALESVVDFSSVTFTDDASDQPDQPDALAWVMIHCDHNIMVVS